MSSNIDQLGVISEKLDLVIGFLAIRDIDRDSTEATGRLLSMGLSSKCMSRVCGTTENAMAVRVSRFKKATSATGSKAGKKQGKAAPLDRTPGP